MEETIIRSADDVFAASDLPQFSVSRLQRYLTCPESYRLHYLERLRPKLQSANFVFGSALHVVLADYFRQGMNPQENFLHLWEGLKDIELHYGGKESWENLRTKGENLLSLFLAEEVQRITKVYAVERSFAFRISNLPMPFEGIIDLVADVDGKKTVVDWKTSASRYARHEVILSDQLTAYFLDQPDAEQLAFCVFVKTKRPKIEWLFAKRDGADFAEFLQKVAHVTSQIEEGNFYKRPGRHCGMCDFLPVCLRDKQAIEKTLIRVPTFSEKGDGR